MLEIDVTYYIIIYNITVSITPDLVKTNTVHDSLFDKDNTSLMGLDSDSCRKADVKTKQLIHNKKKKGKKE